jgi:hypothetical protein
MPKYTTTTVALAGQAEPFLLRIEIGIPLVYKKLPQGDREVLFLMYQADSEVLPLRYNEEYNIFFSGSGCWVKTLEGTTDLVLADEAGTPNQCVYIFERKARSFWTRRIYSTILGKNDQPVGPPTYLLEQLNQGGKCEAIWNLYARQDNPSMFDIVETRGSGLYRHLCTSPIQTWSGRQNFDLATDTDYVFACRNGKFWLTHPNGNLSDLRTCARTRT